MSYNAPTYTYDTFADLRLTVGQASSSVTALGQSTANDGQGGIFQWDSSSSASDDNLNVIKPTALSGNGRWLRMDTRLPLSKITSVGTSGQVPVSNGTNLVMQDLPTGSGTVTSFSAGDLSPLFTTSETNPTTTPALTFTSVSQAQNLIFGSPNGSSGVPVFRQIVGADITNSTINLGKLSNMTPGLIGRYTSGSGTPEYLTLGDTLTVSNTGVLSANAAKVFNVKDYGAKGDGVMSTTTGLLTSGTDDTAAIQACINACWLAGGGIVYFPNGIYKIDGDPWDTATPDLTGFPQSVIPNSQLYIPFDVFKSTNQARSMARRTITLMGESNPNPAPIQYFATGLDYDNVFPYNSGVILWSTYLNTSAAPSTSTLLPSVISTIGNDPTTRYFNYTGIEMENITVRVDASVGYARMNGIDFSKAKSFRAKSVYVDSDKRAVELIAPAVNSLGMLFPQVDGEMHSIAIDVRISGGFWGGVYGCEHMLGEITMADCFYGYLQGGGPQAAHLYSMTTHNCKRSIFFVASYWGLGLDVATVLKVDMLKIEKNSTAPLDYNYEHVVVDSGESLRGQIFYSIVTSGVGLDNESFSKIGASSVLFMNSTRFHPNNIVFDTEAAVFDKTKLNTKYPLNKDADQAVQGFIVYSLNSTGGALMNLKIDSNLNGDWLQTPMTLAV